METLKQSSADDDRSEQETDRGSSYPDDIIEDILSRLPVKTILQSQSVCKPWRSLISTPSFSKLHFTRSRHRTALFISAYDPSARKRYFLSAPRDGGPVTHLVTLENVPHLNGYTPEAKHLNGLICFISANRSFVGCSAYLVNPSTRKIFKVPDSVSWTNDKADEDLISTCYLFGFDESRNEHKILNIRIHTRTRFIETWIFCMSSCSWRKINEKLPMEYGTDGPIMCSICISSVIYFMITKSSYIHMFDLRIEKFSKISTPKEYDDVMGNVYFDILIIKAINGCVGIICYDMLSQKMSMWLLQDSKSCVWVTETIAIPIPPKRVGICYHFDSDSVNIDELIVVSSRRSRNLIDILLYNMNNRCIRSVRLTFDQPFLCLNLVKFNVIKGYAESIVPL